MAGKTYLIGEHAVRVQLEQPWTFAVLSPEQEALVERLRAGEDIGIESVPADRPEQLEVNDSLMGKDPMTRERWEKLSEELEEMTI